jgi:hypothetical protein
MLPQIIYVQWAESCSYSVSEIPYQKTFQPRYIYQIVDL